MTIPRCRILTALLLTLLTAPPSGMAQSLGDLARESQRKKEQSTRKVWTNDDLGTGFPQIDLLGRATDPPLLAPFEASPLPVVEAMLELAGVRPGELVFDLGSGDGRIVIMAAEKFGARGVGIEVNEDLVAESRKAVAAKELEEKVKIIHANALDVDLRPADVVTLYLTPQGLELVRPHLERTLRPGTRVVSRIFEISLWTPTQTKVIDGRILYLYVIR